MNNNMPRTPLSTHLSRSARETEIRIRNIFSGPKKRPPVLLMILIASLILLCGNLVAFRPWPAAPTIVMETQYYDSYANYLEIPMLALPAGEENEAVEAINAGLTELGARYERLKINEGVSQRCTLYPSTTDRYINLVFFEDSGDYGNDGYVRSWVYDKKEGVQVTEEDALALAGTTREALCGGLEELIANDPEYPRGMYEPADIVGFRIKADGQPAFYLSAFVDYVELESGGSLDEWARLYVWDKGEFSRYSRMDFWTERQYPLVPAEETDQLDPPLWCQWFFAGEEPAGGFVDKSLLEPAADLYDPEVCLYRDGFSTPVGPLMSINSSFFAPLIQDSETVGYEPSYQEGDYWFSADGDGFSSTNYYDPTDGTDNVFLLDVTRTDVSTPRGIRVGDNREAVLAAYPGIYDTPYPYPGYDGDYLWYCEYEEGFGPAVLFFFSDADTVQSIQLHFLNY